MGKKILKALRKHEILRQDNTVNTFKIGPNFAHQLAVINMVRQRELVNMLFWWEEECQRLKKLVDEESEPNNIIHESEKQAATDEQDVITKETLDQLKFARERVRMKKSQRPSQRQPDIENDSDDLVAAFRGRSKNAPALTTATGQSQRRLGSPPEYYANS